MSSSSCLIEFIDWRYCQSCWYFWPSFVNYCSLTFSLVHLPPFPKSKYSIYRQCVARKAWGVLSCVGDHILQEFNTLFLTRFRTYKSSSTTPNKNLGEEGVSDYNTCRKVYLQVNLLDSTHRQRHLVLLSISLIFLRYVLTVPSPGFATTFLKKPLALCWNFKQPMGARNRVGIRLSYRPARLHMLADWFLKNNFFTSLKV